MGLTAVGERNLRRKLALKDEEIDSLWETIEWLNHRLEEKIPVPAYVSVQKACIALMREEGKTIAAVKLYRDKMGVDLRTAVLIVRKLKEEILAGRYGDFNPILNPYNQ